MFPHPQDLIASAAKIQRDNDLMVVATTITKTPFPKSVILDKEDDLIAACKNKYLVIKREFSDSNNSTYLPPKDGPNSRLTQVGEKYKKTRELYDGIQSLPPPTWMGQPFIPSLLHKGELRAFVVGGRVQYVIHTLREEQQYVDNYTPLHLLE
jgi:hypothetical protein